MRRLLLLSCTLILILCGCKNKNKNTSTVSAQDTVMTVTSLLTDTVLPQSIDLKQDISRYSFQELRLLRSYPYGYTRLSFYGSGYQCFLLGQYEMV